MYLRNDNKCQMPVKAKKWHKSKIHYTKSPFSIKILHCFKNLTWISKQNTSFLRLKRQNCVLHFFISFFLNWLWNKKISLKNMSWYRSVYVCCYSIHYLFNVIINVGWPTIHILTFKHNQSDRCILFWTIISLHFTTFYHAFSFQ
jgi:hypothetical protein